MDQLKQQLADAMAELQAAQQDLARDEEIFAQRVMEMAKLRDDMAAMASAAQQERAAAAAQIQHLQADLRRCEPLVADARHTTFTCPDF